MYKVEKGKPFYFALSTLLFSYNMPKTLEKTHLKQFWLKFSVVKVVAIMFAVIQPILHVAMTLKNKTGIDISEDLAVVIGSIGALTVCALFMVQTKKWTDFLSDITFFEDVGDISKFEKRMKYFNLVTTFYCGFCVVGIMIYGLIHFAEITACEELNQQKGLHEICGTFYPIWLPFKVTNLTSIITISVTQTLVCVTILPAGAMICCIIWESTEILIIHINILKGYFINLFEGPGELSDRLRICINYHVRILSLASRLNILVKFTCSHMAFWAAIVFGVILNQMIRTTVVTGAIFLIGYITAIFFLCHSGQIIVNETLSVVDAVWASNWHKADSKTMKALAFIIFRSQRPIYLEALPLGTLDYPLFVMILKTSYSYLTLLNQPV